MRLSGLQKYILRQCFISGQSRISKKIIESYYTKSKISRKALVNDITRSVDRLIYKDFLIGIGRKTSRKWIIQEVQLTPLGRKAARGLFGRQQKLPLVTRSQKIKKTII